MKPMQTESHTRGTVCQRLRTRTLVIPWTRSRTKMDQQLDRQAIGEVELNSENDDATIRQKRASNIQVLISAFKRRAQDKARWTILNPLQRRPKFCGNATQNHRVNRPTQN